MIARHGRPAPAPPPHPLHRGAPAHETALHRGHRAPPLAAGRRVGSGRPHRRGGHDRPAGPGPARCRRPSCSTASATTRWSRPRTGSSPPRGRPGLNRRPPALHRSLTAGRAPPRGAPRTSRPVRPPTGARRRRTRRGRPGVAKPWSTSWAASDDCGEPVGPQPAPPGSGRSGWRSTRWRRTGSTSAKPAWRAPRPAAGARRPSWAPLARSVRPYGGDGAGRARRSSGKTGIAG